MTAVLAEQLTRESVFQALHARRCYTTTFARILMDFSVNGQPMGSELKIDPGDVVEFAGSVHGTAAIDRLEIVRDNRDVYCIEPNQLDAKFHWRDRPNESAYYYLRVTQCDGEMAWSSPVWVDL
jgi:hypothetical protein